MRYLDMTKEERRELMDEILAEARRTGDFSRFDATMDQMWDELLDEWKHNAELHPS